MRALMWFFRLILFLLLFGFAVKNDHVVNLFFFFESGWRLPLVFVILIAFIGGALLGVTATVTSLLRQHREISRLRKQLDRAAAAQGAAVAGTHQAHQAPEAF
jgi:uncharacterized integral membrane protein